MHSASRSLRSRTCLAAGAAAIFTLAVPALALAQATAAPPSRWTIELYGGAASNTESSDGSAGAAFPAGAPFTTAASTPSRLQSSWYFGDGSTMLNQVMAQFSTLTGTQLARIVPLDAALLSSATRRKGGATFGLRVSRTLSPRLALEFSVERNQGAKTFTDEATAAFETTRDSFKEAFEDLLATAPVTNLSVSSTLTTRAGSSSQTRVAGAARWSLVTGSRTSVYAVAGGGLVMNGKDDLQGILNGSYAFRMYGAYPMSETDRAVISVSSPSNAVFGLLGGGVTRDLSARVGIRADVRVMLSPNSDAMSVTGSPSVGALTPANVLPSLTNPAIQFSSTTGVPSSLSATIPAHTTFSSSGLNRQVSFTVGIFRRF